MSEVAEKKKDVISESMGKMYDLAIDHAIETVRQGYIYGHSVVNPVLDAIVVKLKALKK